MKILYAGNFEWPSEQARAIQAIHTGHALARAGARVRLVTMRPAAGPSTSISEALALYGLRPHSRFSTRSVPVIRIPETLGFIEVHKRLAITNFSYCAGAGVHLLTMHSGGRPDWVFTRDPRVAWTFIKLRPATGVRVIYEAHELFGTRPRDNRSLELDEQWGVAGRTRALEGFVLEHADRLIALTHVCRKLIIDAHGVPESRIQTIPDGTQSLTQGASRAPNPQSIFYAGQLYRWKGVDTLIRALAQVPRASLTVVGSGERENGLDADRIRLKRLAADLGVSDRVTFRSFVPYSQVPEMLRQAAVAVAPLPDVLMSRYFTSPLKIFDAMAAGAPIVASDLDSVRDVLRDGENAVLVEPDSPEALAAGIRRVLDEPELAAKLSATARTDVAQYTWDRRAERILDFLVPSSH